MQRLTERDWIKQVGVRDVPGRPGLFGTTQEFLSYFNIGSLKDLPPLMEQRDFSEIARDLDVPLPPEVLAALEGEPLEVQQDMFEAPEGEQESATAEPEDSESVELEQGDEESGVLEPDGEKT